MWVWPGGRFLRINIHHRYSLLLVIKKTKATTTTKQKNRKREREVVQKWDLYIRLHFKLHKCACKLGIVITVLQRRKHHLSNKIICKWHRLNKWQGKHCNGNQGNPTETLFPRPWHSLASKEAVNPCEESSSAVNLWNLLMKCPVKAVASLLHFPCICL